jgi:hypothetical protein
LASAVHPDWGTGSILKFQERIFILTCKHVVKEEYKSEQIKYFFRDEREQTSTDSKDDIKNASLIELQTTVPKTYAVTLLDVRRFYSDDEDDLVLLEINPTLELFKNYNFYHITLNIEVLPKVDTKICLIGFPRELIRTRRDGSVSSFPYCLGSRVLKKTFNADEYHKKKHFLIEGNIDDKQSINHKGLSGCGIWAYIPIKPQEVWTTNFRLLGVQIGMYKEGKVLKATRIERVIELLERIKA